MRSAYRWIRVDIPPQVTEVVTDAAPGVLGAILAYFMRKGVPIALSIVMLVGGSYLAYIGAKPFTRWLGMNDDWVVVYRFLIGLVGILGFVKFYQFLDAVDPNYLWLLIRDWIVEKVKRLWP